MKSRTLLRLTIVALVVLVTIAALRFFQVPIPGIQGSKPSVPSAPPPVAPPQPTPAHRLVATLTAGGEPWGKSSCYIGATEGSSNFDIADMQDIGINTYRLFGGMPRWEPEDDDGRYGWPSIAQIKADPAIINWTAWDRIMTNPPKGSDYWWIPKLPRWQGNARTIFSDLQQAHIRAVITLRNQDDQLQPKWAPNPPQTEADWNEWWEYVFALVYWLNVRNHYQINDFEVFNEPEIHEQGWRGTQAQYFEFVHYTHDAIDYVYRTFLPGQSYHVYAPSSTVGPTGREWPHDALKQIPDAFDSVSIHNYTSNITPSTEQVHTWLKDAGRANYPIWFTEWGSYEEQYNSINYSVVVLTNLVRQSLPGSYVYGSHIFSLYDFDTTFTGLITYTGAHRPTYYSMRMGIRAMQGCRTTYQTKTSVDQLNAITTADEQHNLYLLVTNLSQEWYDISADLSKLLPGNSKAAMWQFDAAHMDSEMGERAIEHGKLTVTIPADGAVLLKIAR